MNDELKKELFKEFKDLITTETVVGEPVYLGDTVIVPFVEIYFGFGSGTSKSSNGNQGFGGGGKVVPTAVLIIHGERVEIFSVKNASPGNTVDRIINLVPDLISKFKKKKDKKDKVREAALEEAQKAMREEAETAALEAKTNIKE